MQSRGLLLASSDIHSPKYLVIFKYSLDKLNIRMGEPCAFILAGDIVDRGNVIAAEPVFKYIINKFNNINVIAVFGNEEYHELEDKFKKQYNFIKWLNDEITYIKCNNNKIGIVGTRGSLEKPTKWQRKHMPWLEKVYRERPERIRTLLKESKKNSDKTILVSHYAVSKKTIKGENPAVWPYLYDPRMEKVIIEEKPDIVVHGHSHKGKPFAMLEGIPVYNVALPLNRKIIIVRQRSGLEGFFQRRD